MWIFFQLNLLPPYSLCLLRDNSQASLHVRATLPTPKIYFLPLPHFGLALALALKLVLISSDFFSVTRLNPIGDPSQPHVLEPSKDRKNFFSKTGKQETEDLDWTVEYVIPEKSSSLNPSATRSGRVSKPRAWDADMVS